MNPFAARSLAFAAALLLPSLLRAEGPDFREAIQPLFAQNCLECHGPDKQKGGLRLDRKDASHAEAIVPGDPDASEILSRVTSDDPDERMPPEGSPLSPAEIDRLRSWITAGARWQGHWAYEPLATGPLPEVRNPSWVRNPIDRHVLARLEAQAITPSPEADRHTLIKRLSHDLTGLPPTPAEADAFAADPSPTAYEDLVDRLLASPHFGERWGRHWLDKARYADSDGYEKDRPRPDAWRYRDWVIQSINRDLPLDQFTVQQLAGDLLPGADHDTRLATAFHRQTLTNTEGGTDQEQFRVEAVFDRTETTGAIWLGLTVGCARCHSHKYDAITQEEYYQLFAFFNNGDETNHQLPLLDWQLADHQRRQATHEKKLAALQVELAAAKAGWEDAFTAWETRESEALDAPDALKLHPASVIRITASPSRDLAFRKEEDGSWFVSGSIPEGPVDFTADLLLPEVDALTGIRIETLPDARIPRKGPGYSSGGNFVLSEVVAVPAFVRATADHSQGGWPVAHALDGNLKTGWAIAPQAGKLHHATFFWKTPRPAKEERNLRLTLRQHYGSRHVIGRIRFHATTGTGSASKLPGGIAKILALAPEARSDPQRRTLEAHFLRTEFAPTKAVYTKIDKLGKTAPGKAAMSVRVISQRAAPRETRILDRGEFLHPRETVEPGGLAVLPPLLSRHPGSTPDRLDFARWLMAPENPLPPRVLANHLWARLFGAGLVRTVDDFGVRGELPTHPLLLDWLAAEYRRLGWSRKALLKTILTSSAYRQSARHRPELLEIDPENRLLARQNRFRVEAEIVRDLSLATSGLLSKQIGGPSVFPPLPPSVAALSYNNNFKWKTSAGEDRYRRGLYTFFKRTSPHPNLIAFDCPDSNTTNLARRVSNTPIQALTTLNNEVFVEAAQALAGRILTSAAATDDPGRIDALLRTCLIRPVEPFERSRFRALLEECRTHYRDHPDEAGLLASAHRPEPVPPAEFAAWVALSRIALNLDEFLTRE